MATLNRPLRILVADDNEMMRNGVCSLLLSHSGWSVCGEALDGRDAVNKAVDLRPGVILLDVSMPNLNGFETARRIHELVPQAEILIVTEQDSAALACLEPQEGVRGYVTKSTLVRDLEQAVEAAEQHKSRSHSAAV